MQSVTQAIQSSTGGSDRLHPLYTLFSGQWYNNGHQEVVTSIHFAKIKTMFKIPWIQTQARRSFSHLQSRAVTTRSQRPLCVGQK